MLPNRKTTQSSKLFAGKAKSLEQSRKAGGKSDGKKPGKPPKPDGKADKSGKSADSANAVTEITPDTLRGMALPWPEAGGDKEERGRVFVVGGAVELPGAVILAAIGALRAGAGKLQIATVKSIAVAVGVAVPESFCLGLPEGNDGEIVLDCAENVLKRANQADAALFGPGMREDEATKALLKAVLLRLEKTTVVLDAGAVSVLADTPDLLHCLAGQAILTPHAGEMATMLGWEKDAIKAEPLKTAREAASRFQAVVALKGRDTYIAAPDGTVYCNRAGNVGLATSGSGDALAGVITGLAARGADALQATIWGVHLHAKAGEKLAQRMGTLGFLARELLAEIPPLLREFEPPTGK